MASRRTSLAVHTHTVEGQVGSSGILSTKNRFQLHVSHELGQFLTIVITVWGPPEATLNPHQTTCEVGVTDPLDNEEAIAVSKSPILDSSGMAGNLLLSTLVSVTAGSMVFVLEAVCIARVLVDYAN